MRFLSWSTSKCKFSDLPLLALKFTKFFMSFLEPRPVLLQTFHNSLMLWELTLLYFFILNFFNLKLYMLLTKGTNQVQIFRLSTPCMKITQLPYVIFQATSPFSFKFCIIFQCHSTQFLWHFLAETLRFRLL